jgi:CBS domain-containing protein
MNSLYAIGEPASKDVSQRKLAAAMLANQKAGQPVHRWPIIEKAEEEEWEHGYRTIGQFMSRDLFTVNPDDLIDFAASLMDWRHIRHVPVEDQEGRLLGLVTHRALLRLLTSGANRKLITVREIMVKDPVTVSPSTSSLDAIRIMRNRGVGCLPVVEGDQLVGIVTSYDFLEASARLFQQHLKEPAEEIRTRTQGV